MREFYIGIDPGKQGFACISGPEGLRHIPLDDELAFIQAMWELKDEDVLACVENVHAMPSQGRSSIFTFGVGLGTVLGILKALGTGRYHDERDHRIEEERQRSSYEDDGGR